MIVFLCECLISDKYTKFSYTKFINKAKVGVTINLSLLALSCL